MVDDSQDEAEMVVLQIDELLKMSVSTSGTRKTRAIRKMRHKSHILKKIMSWMGHGESQ